MTFATSTPVIYALTAMGISFIVVFAYVGMVMVGLYVVGWALSVFFRAIIRLIYGHNY